jgi:hypothetical protein
MGVVVGHPISKLMHVSFADQNHARLVQASNGGGVEVRNPLGEDFGARGGSNATRGEEVFDGNRDSVQRATVLTFAYFAFRFRRGLSAFLLGDGNEAVQLGLELINSLDSRIEQLHWRDFFFLE